MMQETSSKLGQFYVSEFLAILKTEKSKFP